MPGSSSLSSSVLIRDHIPFPDETAGHAIEIKPEMLAHIPQRSLSEEHGPVI